MLPLIHGGHVMQLVYGKKMRKRPSNTLTMADTPVENLANNSPNAMEVNESGWWLLGRCCDSDQCSAGSRSLKREGGERGGREGKITGVQWSCPNNVIEIIFWIIILMTILEITEVTDFLLLVELAILPIATFAYHLENMPGRRLLEQQPEMRINGIS